MSKQPQVFYTSDTHVGHRLVAQDRGFFIPGAPLAWDDRLEKMVGPADTGAHDRALALHWDTVVRPQDIVFILGDIGISSWEYVLDWHSKRPGQKHLIIGNHDQVYGFHRDSYKHYNTWMKVFDSIQPYLRRKLGGHYFLMSHFPYAGTGAEGHGVEDRALQYRLPDMGLPLLHGHTHGQEKYHVSDKGSHELHVGLDAWDGKLVHQDTVQDWLEAAHTRSPALSFYM